MYLLVDSSDAAQELESTFISAHATFLATGNSHDGCSLLIFVLKQNIEVHSAVCSVLDASHCVLLSRCSLQSGLYDKFDDGVLYFPHVKK